jgi:stalled ribosome rescue protein Dom34
MKHTGVWIDKDKAHIISIENGVEDFLTVTSDMTYFKAKGGSGQRFKSGPQDVIKDSKYLEREKQQLKVYFKDIVDKIKDTNALVIMGPASTNQKLSKELETNYKDLASKVKDVIKVDSMTDNQIKAWVKDYFKLS